MILGVTGNMASGKSLVARMMVGLFSKKSKKATVISMDDVGHECLKNKILIEKLRGVFGEKILRNDEIDRSRLGEIVFSNKESLIKLNKIVHPMLKKIVIKQARDLIEEGYELVVVEGALLFEIGLNKLCDRVLLLESEKIIRKKRLKERNSHLSDKDISDRIASQKEVAEKVRLSDFYYVNNGNKKDLEKFIYYLFESF